MGAEKAFFSIIVPTCNRPRQPASCLKFLSHIEYPRDFFEVVVVNYNSKMTSDSMVAFSASWSPILRESIY